MRGGVSNVVAVLVFHYMVFPTCVGVFLSFVREVQRPDGLPHVRGGVSPTLNVNSTGAKSSPRTWGVSVNPFT